jgi:hypothetical protein
MRRIRKEATKVWHNPEINTSPRRNAGSGSGSAASSPNAEDRRAQSQHRAALEALFAPKREPELEAEAKGNVRAAAAQKAAGRIVLPAVPNADPRTTERQKLLNKLLIAEGRPNVSKAADDFAKAGFTLPDDQDVHLKLLEHADEERVCEAITCLGTLLAGELPKRRAVLESRLRRIEEFAEDATTREAARLLRRAVNGRGGAPSQATPTPTPTPAPVIVAAAPVSKPSSSSETE